MFPIHLSKLADLIKGTLIRGENVPAPIKELLYSFSFYQKPYLRYLGKRKSIFLDSCIAKSFCLKDLKLRQSAGVVTTEKFVDYVPSYHPLVIVKSVDQCLLQLAFWQRKQSKAVFVGVTGSHGKTTTKEMLGKILQQNYQTYSSHSSFNAMITMPSHLFDLTARHEMVVMEMGMLKLGDITTLCSLVHPQIGVITNVTEAHVGNLGGDLKNVVKAKQELIDGVHPQGVMVLNADDLGSKGLSVAQFKGQVYTFGIHSPASLRAEQVQFSRDGMKFQVDGSSYTIPSWGEHNVYNALAAITVAKLLDVPVPSIQKGLMSYTPPIMRLQRLNGIREYTLISDTYNANPSSLIAGLKVLKALSHETESVAVIGAIGDMGSYQEEAFRRVGRELSDLNPDLLITVGTEAVPIAELAREYGFPEKRIHSFHNTKDALSFLKSEIPTQSTIYFKSSGNFKWLVNQLKLDKYIYKC